MTIRPPKSRRAAAIIAAAAVVLLTTSSGTAVADRLITGSDIKDGSIRGVDVRDGSLTAADFRGNIKGAQGPAGPAGSDGADGVDGMDGMDGEQGPAGPAGATGPRGATGPAGRDAGPDEYISWEFTHRVEDEQDRNGRYLPRKSNTQIVGPAVITGIRLSVPGDMRDWFAANCVDGGVYVRVESAGGVSMNVSQSGLVFEDPADIGALSAMQSKPFEGETDCFDADYQGKTIPDFDAVATFAVEYLQPDNVELVN